MQCELVEDGLRHVVRMNVLLMEMLNIDSVFCDVLELSSSGT